MSHNRARIFTRKLKTPKDWQHHDSVFQLIDAPNASTPASFRPKIKCQSSIWFQISANPHSDLRESAELHSDSVLGTEIRQLTSPKLPSFILPFCPILQAPRIFIRTTGKVQCPHSKSMPSTKSQQSSFWLQKSAKLHSDSASGTRNSHSDLRKMAGRRSESHVQV